MRPKELIVVIVLLSVLAAAETVIGFLERTDSLSVEIISAVATVLIGLCVLEIAVTPLMLTSRAQTTLQVADVAVVLYCLYLFTRPRIKDYYQQKA